MYVLCSSVVACVEIIHFLIMYIYWSSFTLIVFLRNNILDTLVKPYAHNNHFQSLNSILFNITFPFDRLSDHANCYQFHFHNYKRLIETRDVVHI